MLARLIKNLIGIFLVLLIFPKDVLATLSCGISISPSEVLPNSSNAFQLTFSNTSDSGNLNWFKATKPFVGLTTDGSALYGWTKDYTVDGSDITLSNGTLEPGGSITLNLTIGVGDIVGSSGNWGIQGSGDGGASPIGCSGSTGLSVTGSAPDTTAPTISGLAVSSINNSSAVVSWTTNEPATSLVKYDVNADQGLYPFSESSSDLKTSHSVTLSNLGAVTSYYYQACSTDTDSNQTCVAENSFTTTASAATTTSAAATTTTTTTTTVTVTPVVVVDRTGPAVTMTTDFDQVFEQSPIVGGRTSDASGIRSVEYSIDGGENWMPVIGIYNLGAKTIEFEFVPDLFEDGNYELVARATDLVGNKRSSKSETLIIDRLPPLVGGNLLSLGPLVLSPNKNGVILTMAGLDQRLTLSAVGGPTSVDLFVNKKKYSLPKSLETGLWSGIINFPKKGFYKISTKSVDGAENETSRKLNSVLVVEPGKIVDKLTGEAIEKAKISLYYQDKMSDLWVVWDGSPFGQKNPQTTEADGIYRYFLPSGSYYFLIEAPGFVNLYSNIFSLEQPSPVNAVLWMKKLRTIKIGPFTFKLPAWVSRRQGVNIKLPSVDGKRVESLKGSLAPLFSLPTTDRDFSLSSLRGKSALISFISSWSPPSLEQILVLNDLQELKDQMAVVTLQESMAKIMIFQRRGNYELPIVVDTDGTLVEKYLINTLPTHYFLDRKGMVKEVVTGVLSGEEIREIFNKY